MTQNRATILPMLWPLLTKNELHAFGVDQVVARLEADGMTVESTDLDPASPVQIVARGDDGPALVAVRTATYPSKGALTPDQRAELLRRAAAAGATAWFASVGMACVTYPDRTPVLSQPELCLPLRGGGFRVAFAGLEAVA